MSKEYKMKHLVLPLIFFLAYVNVQAQNSASFSLKEDKTRIMCYTEKESGTSLKNTTVSFKNNSSCDGSCLYVWDYGDNSAQQIENTVSESGTHIYTKDGAFNVNLAVVNTSSIHDTIKNKNILEIQYVSKDADSTNLIVKYVGTGNVETYADVRIPNAEFDKNTYVTPITVYSPVTQTTNYTFDLDEPGSPDQPAGIQSFSYILKVDTTEFKPRDLSLWTYYWEIWTYENDKPKDLIKSIATDSLEYRYVFPVEQYEPGYYVRLKIALDSTKFEDQSLLTYHNLTQCHHTRSQVIEVTDYFFTENSRTEDVGDREPDVPNIFTPGGNDENEVFYFNTNGVDVFTIFIYNSWGTLVYKQEAQTISWTGKDNSGEDCPSGVYYYVITSSAKDAKHKTGGYIHLFRQN